jgi:hypothetical protein
MYRRLVIYRNHSPISGQHDFPPLSGEIGKECHFDGGLGQGGRGMFELASNQALTIEFSPAEVETLNGGGYLNIVCPKGMAKAA